MRSTFHKRRLRMISEINVTPFVDVMLVLLIVFMVSAPLMTSGVSVELPQSQAPALSEGKDPVTVTLQKDGTLLIQGIPCSWKQISAHLKTIPEMTAQTPLYVYADKTLPYGDVVKLFGLLRAGGYKKLALVSDQESVGPLKKR